MMTIKLVAPELYSPLLISLFKGVVISVQNATLVNEQYLLQGKVDSYQDVLFNPDGQSLVVLEIEKDKALDGVIRIWETNTFKSSHLLQNGELKVASMDITLDGLLMVTGDSVGNLTLIRLKDEQTRASFKVGNAPINSIAARGSIAIAMGSINSNEQDVAFQVIDYSTGDAYVSVPVCSNRGFCTGTGMSAAYRKDGLFYAFALTDGTVHFWENELNNEYAILEGNVFTLTNDLIFSPDDTYLIFPAIDGVHVWNVDFIGRPEGKKDDVRIIAKPLERQTILSIALNPDGTILAAGYQDGTVRLWNMDTGDQLTVLEGHTDRVVSLAFSPDGTLLASGGTDGTVRLWGVAG